MIFTKRERKMVLDAVAFFAGQKPDFDDTSPEQWLALLRRVETWSDRHRRLETAGKMNVVEPCDCGRYHRVTVSRMGPKCRAYAESKLAESNKGNTK